MDVCNYVSAEPIYKSIEAHKPTLRLRPRNLSEYTSLNGQATPNWDLATDERVIDWEINRFAARVCAWVCLCVCVYLHGQWVIILVAFNANSHLLHTYRVYRCRGAWPTGEMNWCVKAQGLFCRPDELWFYDLFAKKTYTPVG